MSNPRPIHDCGMGMAAILMIFIASMGGFQSLWSLFLVVVAGISLFQQYRQTRRYLLQKKEYSSK